LPFLINLGKFVIDYIKKFVIIDSQFKRTYTDKRLNIIQQKGIKMKKILIVDDQLFIREVFKKQIELLENVGVLEAANGNEAMGKIKVVRPDLILLDIVMPGKDGLEVLKDIHDDVELRDIPVVIISSHAEDEKVAKAKEYGAREFIDKAQLNNIDFNGLIRKYLEI